MNCEPQSDDMFPGTPNRAIQPEIRACTHSDEVMPRRGIASGQRVLRSMIVRRYVKPDEKGNGPTMSTFMCENLFAGVENSSSGDFVCL